MKVYITFFALFLSVATISGAESEAPSTFFAPAAAPVQTDSLPKGRHTVSSYRNGSSLEVVVENQKIKSLKVDGKEVPENEYDQHKGRVEELLGTSENGRRSQDEMRSYRWSDQDLESLENRFEGMGENLERLGENFEFHFEGMGENLGNMGERLGESIERMFNFGSNGNTMRFEFRGDGNGNWQMDSTGNDRSFEWRSDEMDPKGLNKEMPADSRSNVEAEIREMESMIEKMERQKERMKADLEREESTRERQSRDQERQERDLDRQSQDLDRQGRDAERASRDLERETRRAERTQVREESREASYEVLVQQLQREGLIEDNGRLRKLTVDANELKVNGKKASKEGYARFLELYEQQTGRPLGKGTTISIKKD